MKKNSIFTAIILSAIACGCSGPVVAQTAASPTQLTATCVATPATANINKSVTFSASANGGNRSYSYSWFGACSGNGSKCSRSFTASGSPAAAVIVASGDQEVIANCNANISTPQPLFATCRTVQVQIHMIHP